MDFDRRVLLKDFSHDVKASSRIPGGIGFRSGIVTFAVALALSSGIAVWVAQLPRVVASEETSSLAQFAVVLVSIILTISLVAHTAPGFVSSTLDECTMPRIGRSRLLAWSVLSVIAGGGFGYLGMSLGGGHSSPGLSEATGGLGWLAAIGMNLFLTPFFEELLFRGVLFSALRERLSFFLASLLSAVAFGLVHLAPTAESIVLIGAALWFSFSFESSKSLLPCVIGHAAMNCMYGLT